MRMESVKQKKRFKILNCCWLRKVGRPDKKFYKWTAKGCFPVLSLSLTNFDDFDAVLLAAVQSRFRKEVSGRSRAEGGPGRQSGSSCLVSSRGRVTHRQFFGIWIHKSDPWGPDRLRNANPFLVIDHDSHETRPILIYTHICIYCHMSMHLFAQGRFVKFVFALVLSMSYEEADFSIVKKIWLS